MEEVLEKETLSETDDLFLAGYFLSLLMGGQKTCPAEVTDLCTDDVLKAMAGDCVRVTEEFVLLEEKLYHLKK